MSPKIPRTMLALLTAAGCSALCTAGALAAGAGSTGGTGAPDGAQPSSATPAHAAPASALATWYGPGLYGRRTACGQTLTTALVGVANRSLPCGTLVRMSYGSRSVVLPVIDRGPYGRIGAQWDLTAGAAAALGMTETVRVAAHVVGSAPNSATLGMPAAASAAASAESLAGGASAG